VYVHHSALQPSFPHIYLSFHHHVLFLTSSHPIPQLTRYITDNPPQNTVGGLARTVGGVAGAAGRGIGDTITGATGSAGRPLGDGLGNAASGIEGGTKKVAQGVEDAGQWKSGAKRL
jgi:hypothetical protein